MLQEFLPLTPTKGKNLIFRHQEEAQAFIESKEEGEFYVWSEERALHMRRSLCRLIKLICSFEDSGIFICKFKSWYQLMGEQLSGC